jgi:uncharacterized protein with HEPN domain
MKSNAVLLHFVLEQADSLHQYVADVSEDDFLANEQLRDACCMKILVIGEYCGKLSQDFKATHTEIDWQLIKAARNYYAHDYGELTPRKIWQTIQNDIPELESTLRDILKEIE